MLKKQAVFENTFLLGSQINDYNTRMPILLPPQM